VVAYRVLPGGFDEPAGRDGHPACWVVERVRGADGIERLDDRSTDCLRVLQRGRREAAFVDGYRTP